MTVQNDSIALVYLGSASGIFLCSKVLHALLLVARRSVGVDVVGVEEAFPVRSLPQNPPAPVRVLLLWVLCPHRLLIDGSEGGRDPLTRLDVDEVTTLISQCIRGAAVLST